MTYLENLKLGDEYFFLFLRLYFLFLTKHLFHHPMDREYVWARRCCSVCQPQGCQQATKGSEAYDIRCEEVWQNDVVALRFAR